MKIIGRMKLFTAAAFLFLITSVAHSQDEMAGYKDYFMEGSYLLLENNMDRATDNFEKAYKLDSSSANINYLLGLCYIQSALQKAKSSQ